MVISANAVVDPGAMMVKSFNTSVTYVAMSTSRSSNNFAFWAKAR